MALFPMMEPWKRLKKPKRAERTQSAPPVSNDKSKNDTMMADDDIDCRTDCHSTTTAEDQATTTTATHTATTTAGTTSRLAILLSKQRHHGTTTGVPMKQSSTLSSSISSDDRHHQHHRLLLVDDSTTVSSVEQEQVQQVVATGTGGGGAVSRSLPPISGRSTTSFSLLSKSCPPQPTISTRRGRRRSKTMSSLPSSSSSSNNGDLDDVAASSSSTAAAAVHNNDKRHRPLVKALVAALRKDNLMDVTLVGNCKMNDNDTDDDNDDTDVAQVRASRYVLACRCQALEQLLYAATGPTTNTSLEKTTTPLEVYIGNYSKSVLLGLVEYCFTGALSEFENNLMASIVMPTTTTAAVTTRDDDGIPTTTTTTTDVGTVTAAVKTVLELARCAHQYKFRLLLQEVYQLSRRLLNRHANLACVVWNAPAAFVTCDDGDDMHVYAADILAYAKQTIVSCPQQTLCLDVDDDDNIKNGPSLSFVPLLSCDRLEMLLQHDRSPSKQPRTPRRQYEDDDSDTREWTELVRVKLLQEWCRCASTTNHDCDKVQLAKCLAKQYIDLNRIRLGQDTIQLLERSPQLFDVIPKVELDVGSSSLPIDTVLDSDGGTVEHVLVKGAGMEEVNGIYHYESPPPQDDDQHDSQDDNDREDHMFVLCPNGSMMLYCWNGTWHIAPSVDLSSSLYKCENSGRRRSRITSMVPSGPWQAVGALEPAPTCAWIPSGGISSLSLGADDDDDGGDDDEQVPSRIRSVDETSDDEEDDEQVMASRTRQE